MRVIKRTAATPIKSILSFFFNRQLDKQKKFFKRKTGKKKAVLKQAGRGGPKGNGINGVRMNVGLCYFMP